tara:strand:+ start:264 stop:575 length:312 start_codon:yes stop_codon:yes gene_type:complete
MNHFVLLFAFLGLFNYGSDYEAKEACNKWADAGGTYMQVSGEVLVTRGDSQVWIPDTKPRKHSWRRCNYSSAKTSRVYLGMGKDCNTYLDDKCDFKVKKHFRF